jgi:GT2 family glycosyltransferase
MLSIVTGTRNRPDSISAFVRSILEHTTHPFELLIGDASDDEPFACEDERVRILPETEPLGACRAYNRLFRAARGEFVCFLNDDLEVLPEWSDRIFDVFARHPEVELAPIPLIEPDEPLPFVMLYHDVPVTQMGVVRRAAGEQLGWFDECFRAYGTDVDFTMRFVASGRAMAPVFGRVVHHHKLEDDLRTSTSATLQRDNQTLSQRWRPRVPALRRAYRRVSYRYFRRLSTRWSEGYRRRLLTIPAAPEARPWVSLHPHRVAWRHLLRPGPSASAAGRWAP